MRIRRRTYAASSPSVATSVSHKCCDCQRSLVAMERPAETYTRYGHLQGMLDRDLRTAKCSTSVPRDVKPCHLLLQDKQLVKSTPNRRPRRATYKTLQRLARVLYFGVYLLVIVSVPSILSAPTGHVGMEGEQKEPFWYNPCDTGTASPISGEDISDSSDSSSNISQVYKAIKDAAKRAILQAESFKDEYTQRTAQKNFSQRDDEIPNSFLGWLPSRNQVPKGYGHKANEDLIKSLKMEDAAVDIYEALQKIAVGIEYIEDNQKDGAFASQFANAKGNLKNLLCELNGLIQECRFAKRENIPRNIMPDDQRQNTNETFKDLYTFVIYREYMNTLQYTIEVFEYFHNLESSE